MRDYARVAPTFWTRGSGKRLRGDSDAQIVALYLLTCPASNMIGLFYLSLPTLGHETGLTADRVRAAMAKVSEAEIAFYDEEAELVFLPEGAKYQIGVSLDPKDKRVKGVEKDLAAFGCHPFVAMFVSRYGTDFSLTTTATNAHSHQTLHKAEASPFQAPSKPESESGSEASQNIGSASAAPTTPVPQEIQNAEPGPGAETAPPSRQDGPRTSRSEQVAAVAKILRAEPEKPQRGRPKKPTTDCPNSEATGEEVKAWLSTWKITGDEAEIAHWLDHHRSKGNRFQDWTAAWRTWQRNGVRFGRGPSMVATPIAPPKKPIEQAQLPGMMNRLLHLKAGECVR